MTRNPKTVSLAVCNMKGGVAKTVTAVSLASSLASMGHKTLLIDADFQANATDYLGTKYDAIKNHMTIYHGICDKLQKSISDIIMETKFDNLDIISSCIELSQFNEAEQSPYKFKKWMNHKIIDEYTYIIIDTRPELGHLFKNIMSYADYNLIPIFAEADAISGLRIMFNKLREIQEDFNKELRLAGAVITRFDKRNHTHIRFRELVLEMGMKNGIPILGEISASNAIASSVDTMTPLPFYRPNSNIPARNAYLQLAQTLINTLIVKKGRVPRIPIIDDETVVNSFNALVSSQEVELC